MQADPRRVSPETFALASKDVFIFLLKESSW